MGSWFLVLVLSSALNLYLNDAAIVANKTNGWSKMFCIVDVFDPNVRDRKLISGQSYAAVAKMTALEESDQSGVVLPTPVDIDAARGVAVQGCISGHVAHWFDPEVAKLFGSVDGNLAWHLDGERSGWFIDLSYDGAPDVFLERKNGQFLPTLE